VSVEEVRRREDQGVQWATALGLALLAIAVAGAGGAAAEDGYVLVVPPINPQVSPAYRAIVAMTERPSPETNRAAGQTPGVRGMISVMHFLAQEANFDARLRMVRNVALETQAPPERWERRETFASAAACEARREPAASVRARSDTFQAQGRWADDFSLLLTTARLAAGRCVRLAGAVPGR
jgi:hypothetical protein